MDLFGDVNKIQFRPNQRWDNLLNHLVLPLHTLSQALGSIHKCFRPDFLPRIFTFTKSKVINQRLEMLFI